MTRIFTFTSLIVFTSAICTAQSVVKGCPNLTLKGPTAITNAGEIAEFMLESSESSLQEKAAVIWTTNEGTIEDGQGTNRLKVRAPNKDIDLVVTAEIDGLPALCSNKVVAHFPVALKAHDYVYNIYGDIPERDEKAQLDAFFTELTSHPGLLGFMILYIKPKDPVGQAISHARKVLRHANYRKFDKNRLLFGLDRSDRRQVFLLIIPKEAELPSCENCDLLHRDSNSKLKSGKH